MQPTLAFLPLRSQHNSLPLPLQHLHHHHHPPHLAHHQHQFASSGATQYASSSTSLLPSSHALFVPSFMDSAGPNLNTISQPNSANHNNTSGTSPSSNASALSSTVVSAAPIRKKPGRGPGKKDLKDKPTVSVRWDDGDLTERLITAVEGNERWQGVFLQTSNEPGQVRASQPVAKRDLQREIARHLFGGDPRYDIEDRKVIECLAVSVKNKLFKLTTLFAECKQDLGQLWNIKDEREFPSGSEHLLTWNRVKEKFPQYTRIRDLINKVPVPGTPHLSTSEDPLSPVDRRSPTVHRARTSTASSTAPPRMSGHFPPSSSSSSLKGAVDLPREASASYMEASSMSSYMATSTMSTSTVTSPTYPMQSPRMTGQSGYSQSQSQSQSQHRRMTGPIPGQPRPGQMAIVQPQPQHYPPAQPINPSMSPHMRGQPYPRPQVMMPGAVDPQSQVAIPEKPPASPQSPELGGNPPSPPLSQTIQTIVTTLTERKDRERARAHELEVLRIKREESERVRWHQREMMRLKIQLIRAGRAHGAAVAGGMPGAGPSGSSNVEDDLALAAGLGDDGMSMEGDGEGELDEEMFDPEPRAGRLHHPHGGSAARGGPQ